MFNRRHNDPLDAHERARSLASDRLLEPLRESDETWLAEHLEACDACRVIADAYSEDRQLLRALPSPQPPRDLWAKTSAAIDRERAEAPRVAWGVRGLRWESLAGIAAVLVIGVLIGQSLLASGGASPVQPSPSPLIGTAASPAPGATPLQVPPGDVAWVARTADGTYALNLAKVASVCPQDAAPSPECAPLDQSAQKVQSLDQQPSSVLIAPTRSQAAVVEASARNASGGSILVVPLAFATPAPGSTQSPSIEPSASPIPAGSPSESAPGSSGSPPAVPTASPSPEASPSTEIASPSSPAATQSSEPSQEPSPALSPSPSATAAAAQAIITKVVVVGDAAYSPDGKWLAFSAYRTVRADGPDLYVWRVGDRSAHALTRDHASLFASWLGNRILGNRAVVRSAVDASGAISTPAPDSLVPLTFLIDPATGNELDLDGFEGWRPAVDPTGSWVVYWTGALAYDATARAFLPDKGWLEIAAWPTEVDAPDAFTTTDASKLMPSSAAVHAWDARWDPTGRFVGVWIADVAGNTLGKLGLLAIDPATGRVDPTGAPRLRDVPALSGFAIGDGRIAWSTPTGQDGEGSRVHVMAWTGPDAGKTTTEPATSTEDVIVAH